MEKYKLTRDFINFIDGAPSAFHVVSRLEELLKEKGFTELKETDRFRLERTGRYYVKRNGTSLIAFIVPEKDFTSFSIASAHTDSPCFKIKWDPEISSSGVTTLNVETYGGLLLAPWFDRPLSIAGRVMVQNEDGSVSERLFDFERDMVQIVNLAIHQNREANNGHKYRVQKELLPLFSDGFEKGSFLSAVADKLGVAVESIVDYDLYLYNRQKGTFWGLEDRFFSAPRIDDVLCAYTAARALCETSSCLSMPVVALFDNEETGSGTKQGALSDFLSTTLTRIMLSLGKDEEEKYMAYASSFMLSADNGHAVHPNYSEQSDVVNKPRMNGGVLLKYSANQKYTTDAESAALVRTLCRKAGVPVQAFLNNSDVPGGSTLGNLSSQKVSIRTADIGVAQLAMHSSYETAGSEDTESLYKLFRVFLAR